MKEIIVDFSGCKYLGEIHKILKETFDFPDYYGENLDALWDCMRMYCDYPLHVKFIGVNSLPEELLKYSRKMIKVFSDVHDESPNITFEILS